MRLLRKSTSRRGYIFSRQVDEKRADKEICLADKLTSDKQTRRFCLREQPTRHLALTPNGA